MSDDKNDHWYEIGYKEGRSDAADEIERMTRERDEARSAYNDIDLCKMGQAPCVMLLSAERKVEKLREALTPFADQLQGNYSSQTDEFPIVCGGGMYDIRFTLTLHDFRRARAILAETEKNNDN